MNLLKSVATLVVFLFLSVSYVDAQSTVNLTQFPVDRQLYPRDVSTNSAIIDIAGTINESSQYQSVKAYVYKNGQTNEDIFASLTYSSGTANFNLQLSITAELSNHTITLVGIKADGTEITIASSDEVVAGDVYIVNGQSNAIAGAGAHPDDYDPFSRSYTDEANWNLINRSFPGQWAARMAKEIITTLNIPVAIFNEAVGGAQINTFLKNYGDPGSNNYQKLLGRLDRAGVKDDVRAIFWYQGETDGWYTGFDNYVNSFNSLYDDWMIDYNQPKVYMYQVRFGMCGHPNPEIMEAHRRLARDNGNIEIIATTRAQTDNDINCHFVYIDGHQVLGYRLYRIVAHQLYGQSGVNAFAPDVDHIRFSTPSQLTITMKNVTGGLTVEGSPWNDFRLEGSLVSITDGWTNGNEIVLQLSGEPTGLTGVTYLGHKQNNPDWIINNNEDGILTFYNVPICTNCGGKPGADLELSAFASKTQNINEGDILDLTLELRNQGPDDVASVEVALQLPANLSVNSPGGSYDQSSGKWTISNLANGATAQLSLNVTVNSATSGFEVFAQVVNASLPDPDATVDNNTSGTPIEDDEVKIDFSITPPVGSGIDLETKISVNRTDLKIYSNYIYQIEISNTSSRDATGVVVDASLPDDMAFVQHDEDTGQYSDWTGTWNVGTIPANGKANLEVELFTLSEDNAITYFVQVMEANESDNDSSPDNAPEKIVAEDDEASVTIGSGAPNPVDTESPVVTLNTSASIVSGIFTVDVQLNEDVNGFTIDDVVVSNGSKSNFSGSGQNYQVDITPTAAGQVNVNIPAGSFSDAANNMNLASNQLSVNYSPVVVGDNVDLQLTLSVDKTNFRIYEEIQYTLRVFNNGTITARDILIDFPFPDDFVYTDKTTTSGFYDDWIQEWTIDQLDGNSEAVLELTLFSLQADGPRKAFVEVVRASPQDVDSTPGNDTDQIADEDDEASITILPYSNRTTAFNPHNTFSGVSINAFPVPVQGELNLAFGQEVNSQATLQIFDASGKAVFSSSYLLEEGQQLLQLPVHDLANGVYWVRLFDDTGLRTCSFVK